MKAVPLTTKILAVLLIIVSVRFVWVLRGNEENVEIGQTLSK